MGYHSFSSNQPAVGHRFTLPPSPAVAAPEFQLPLTPGYNDVPPTTTGAVPGGPLQPQQPSYKTWSAAPPPAYQASPPAAPVWHPSPPAAAFPPPAVPPPAAAFPPPAAPPPAAVYRTPEALAPQPSNDAARQRFLVASNSNFNNPPPLSPVAQALARRHQPTARYQDINGNWQTPRGQ